MARTQEAMFVISKAERWLKNDILNRTSLYSTSNIEALIYFKSRGFSISDAENIIWHWYATIIDNLKKAIMFEEEIQKLSSYNINRNLLEYKNKIWRQTISWEELSEIDLDGNSLMKIFAGVEDTDEEIGVPCIVRAIDWYNIKYFDDWIITIIEDMNTNSILFFFHLCRSNVLHTKLDFLKRKFRNDFSYFFSKTYRIDKCCMAVYICYRLGLEDKYNIEINTVSENIIKLQNDDGGWSIRLEDDNINTSDVLATCYAIHALATISLSKYNKVLNKAKTWLFNKQDSMGYWNCNYGNGPAAYTTVLCLDAINLCEGIGVLTYKETNQTEDILMNNNAYKNIALLATTISEQDILEDVIRLKGYDLFPDNVDRLHYRKTVLNNGVQLNIITLVNQGNTRPGAASNTAINVAKLIKPDVIIIGGIGFGIKNRKYNMCDILVSTHNWFYEYEAIRNNYIEDRSDIDVLPSSSNILRLFKNCKNDFEFGVHFGLMASGNKLVDSPEYINLLLKRKPNLIGGEMEGYGIASACFDENIESVLVKGICDWGENKGNEYQAQAAENAFKYIISCLETIKIN